MDNSEFTLSELQLAQSLLMNEKAAFHASLSEVVTSLKVKLFTRIGELQAREERQTAAVKLRAVATPGAAE